MVFIPDLWMKQWEGSERISDEHARIVGFKYQNGMCDLLTWKKLA